MIYLNQGREAQTRVVLGLDWHLWIQIFIILICFSMSEKRVYFVS